MVQHPAVEPRSTRAAPLVTELCRAALLFSDSPHLPPQLCSYCLRLRQLPQADL